MIYQHLTLDAVTEAGAVTVVADLINGPQYANARYASAIGPQRPSSLAGQSTYAEVDDEILVDVLGATPADAARNLEALLGIIGQAGEWWGGENTSAIQIRALTQGATGAPRAAFIIGAAGGAPATVNVQATGQAGGSAYVIRDVALRFTRRARWLAARESVVLAASTGNPTVATITWASDQGRVRAPAGIEVDTSSGNLSLGSNLLITADDDAAVQILDVTTWTVAAQFATVAAATSRPFNGTNLLRLTPAAANTAYAATSVATNVIGTSRLLGFWLCLRGNGTADWLITLNFYQYVAPLSTVVRSAATVVYTGSSSASYVPLGLLAVAGRQNVGAEIELTIQASTVSGGPTLDLSHLVVVQMDTPGLNILQTNIAGDNNTMSALPAEILNVARQGVVQSAGPGFDNNLVAQNYAGDMEITTSGTSMAVTYLATEGSAFTIGSGSTKANFTFTGYRRRASLIPQ